MAYQIIASQDTDAVYPETELRPRITAVLDSAADVEALDGTEKWSPGSLAILAEAGFPTLILSASRGWVNGNTGGAVSGGDSIGASFPSGGTTGQQLAKQSDADGDAVWVDPVAWVEKVFGADTVTWDGKTDGLPFFENPSDPARKWYKVSDVVPTKDELVGTYIVEDNHTVYGPSTTTVNHYDEYGFGVKTISGQSVFIVPEEAAGKTVDLSDINFGEVTFPEIGIYFRRGSNYEWTCSLTIEGYLGFPYVVNHPLPPELGGMPTLASDGSDAGKTVKANAQGTGYELVKDAGGGSIPVVDKYNLTREQMIQFGKENTEHIVLVTFENGTSNSYATIDKVNGYYIHYADGPDPCDPCSYVTARFLDAYASVQDSPVWSCDITEDEYNEIQAAWKALAGVTE